MRKNTLRVLGLLLVVWSLTAVAPPRQADAQSRCACTLFCVIGKTCCVTQITAGCHEACLDTGDPCPSFCACTLDCVIGKHCCTGVSAEGRCTQTCIANGTPCSL